MSGDKISIVPALLISVSLLGACSTTPSSHKAQQGEIIARWTHCIQKFSHAYTGSAAMMARRAEAHCEGHRRDVVATFPGHLKNRIESLLSQRAYKITTAQVIKTTGSDSWSASKDAQFDILRMRLLEARKADL
ncbi:hypothetical protein [Granulosicoccus antarcticus]|uniref:Lipoprotein n=1 Tax=Granulosicoccus antarcticus IMCC3135 TaxID=1192854 RepID=A0A2Z2P402_9GAMM|nr:hypothetical protein [Granulosicoccus antarcticus]ASJ75397.1 hypothetical protein IMCC3135_26710 [Granulosicoccus antarcticus IMCC3135]